MSMSGDPSMHRVAPVTDRAFAYALALMPLTTFTVCYLIAAHQGHVASCIPWFDGCTSTSSTGRRLPERFVFIPGMLASAAMVAVFWRRCALHMVSAGAPAGYAKTMRWLGIAAAACLAVYALVIGQPGDLMRAVRRFGVTGFFVTNYIAQWLFTLASHNRADTRAGSIWLFALPTALAVLALAGELAKWSGMPGHAANNIVEWNAIVVVCAYFAVVGFYFFSTSSGRPASPRL